MANRIIEAMDFESDIKNWKYPFKTMTKKYGKDFIETIKAMWQANSGSQTPGQFCEMNDLTEGFFQNIVYK